MDYQKILMAVRSLPPRRTANKPDFIINKGFILGMMPVDAPVFLIK
jgi:hypothetical protein